MAFVARPLPPTTIYGVDAATKFTSAMANALAGATFPKSTLACSGQPVSFLIRTVPLPHNSAKGDIDLVELTNILKARGPGGRRLMLGLYQHVREGRWTAGGDVGKGDGAVAAACAHQAGYTNAHLARDMESLANPDDTQAVMDDIVEWGKPIIAVSIKPWVYVGFDSGITPALAQQLRDLGIGVLFWYDFGPRVVPGGAVCKQLGNTFEMPGICGVDPDEAHPDDLGNVLSFMIDDTADSLSPQEIDNANVAGEQAVESDVAQEQNDDHEPA